MFRFIYALNAEEKLDPGSLRMDEFDGFERADDVDTGAMALGRRCADLASSRRALEQDAAWASYRPGGAWKDVAARINSIQLAGTLMIEPWEQCADARALWHLSETIQNPDVKIAWSDTWGLRAAQPPAVVVPVLNLRLGLVRLSDAGSDTVEFAKRLAGIGFEGYFVADPPAGNDRLGAARRIVEIARDVIQPRKPMRDARPAARQ